MATLNPSLPPTAVRVSARWAIGLGVAAVLGVGAAVFTAIDLGGQVVLWENAHWTVFYAMGFAVAFRGFRTSSGPERRVRKALATVSLFWLAAQVAWLAQSSLGIVVFPLPSDLVTFAALVPAVVALDLAVRLAVDRRERLGLYLDCAITFLAIATGVTLAFGYLVTGHDVLAGALVLSFPIACLSIAGAGLIAALATRASARDGGLYALLIGTFLYGVGYLTWVAAAPATPPPGSTWNYLFSIGAVAIGIAGATFRADSHTPRASTRFAMVFRDGLPAAAVAIAVVCLVVASTADSDNPLVRPLGWSVILTAVLRQVALVRERSAAVRAAEESADHLSAAEERHRRLINTIPAVVYIDERLTADLHDSTMIYVSAEANRLLSYTPAELTGDPKLWIKLVHPDDAAAVAVAEDEHFATGEPLRQTFRMHDRAGNEVWVLDEATLVRLPQGRLQSHGVLMDITAQKDAEAAVRESEEQQRRIIESASSAYVAIDAEGMVIDWNERATETFGWPPEEAIGRSLSGLIIPEGQRVAHEAGLRRFAITGAGPLVGRRVELLALDNTGREFPVEMTIWPVRAGGVLTYSALIHDITERRRLEDELRHQAFHDSLTGLANRALFADRLDHALQRRGTGDVGVLFFDVDDFKLINDGLGHAAGDGLLIEVARRLGELVRAGDTAARLGGDEFGVLLEHTTLEEATRVADRIIAAFLPSFEVGGHRITARASIGLAFGHLGSEAASVLREADAAMYTAKHRGKGVWQVYDPSMAGDGLLEIELRTDLKLAIEQGELSVAYQPIVELATRRTVGVEALARWHHPTRGDIEPSQFIPLAEAADLIVPLGRWILEEACRAVQGWRASADGPDDLRLSVNISPRQLLHGSIIEHVQMALAGSGLEPADLTLEITEGVLVEEAGASLAALEGLKALGVRIAIDDFGTGYSSLSYLSRLPIDVLKIDRSFVADIGTSRQAAALVRSIVKIGQTLHLETVAEGVETEEQLDRLVQLGAKLGQGYLFARPLAAADLATLLLAAGTLDAA
jgi:diguanylate cyclase (GGDEF)-like protein/PAS domain S-box-containing protein